MRARTRAAAGMVMAAMLAGMSGCIIVSTHSDGERLSREEALNVPALAPGEALPTVATRQSEGFAKLRPGMSVDEFRMAFPTAVFARTQSVNGESIDAYSVTIRERLRHNNSRYAFTHTDSAWFYFNQSGLVRWGKPNQWSDQ